MPRPGAVAERLGRGLQSLVQRLSPLDALHRPAWCSFATCKRRRRHTRST